MTFELYIAFVTTAVIIIVVPGPTNMVVVSNSMKFGFRKSLWTVLGAACSHSSFFCVTTLGLAAILLTSAHVLEVLKWFGAVYLVWMGVRLWMAKEAEDEIGDGRYMATARSLFTQGFLVNTTNPKALAFYAAFFPPFVNPSLPALPQLLMMGATFVAIFLIVAILHGLAADRVRAMFQTRRSQRVWNRMAGSFLIGAGLLLATKKN